jgi:hypothetical protein
MDLLEQINEAVNDSLKMPCDEAREQTEHLLSAADVLVGYDDKLAERLLKYIRKEFIDPFLKELKDKDYKTTLVLHLDIGRHPFNKDIAHYGEHLMQSNYTLDNFKIVEVIQDGW